MFSEHNVVTINKFTRHIQGHLPSLPYRPDQQLRVLFAKSHPLRAAKRVTARIAHTGGSRSAVEAFDPFGGANV